MVDGTIYLSDSFKLSLNDRDLVGRTYELTPRGDEIRLPSPSPHKINLYVNHTKSGYSKAVPSHRPPSRGAQRYGSPG